MIEFDHDEDGDLSLIKFENMLKTNDILFFDADEFEQIICHYLEIGKTALARKAVKIALSQHPDSTALKLLKVEVLLLDDKLIQADELLNRIYEIEPSNPDVYIHKASILSKQGLHREAIDLLEGAEAILQDDEDVDSIIAMEYMFVEDYQQAKNYFIKCLQLDQEDSAALYNLIFCFNYLDQNQEAIEFLNDFLNHHPYSEIGWHQLGLQYKIKRQYEQALDAFEYAIISDDEFVGAYMEKAKILERFNRYSEAIDCYLITLDIEDPTAFAYLRIGKCYQKLQSGNLALQYYNKALQEDPLLDKAWVAITDFFCIQRDFGQALYYIERAIAIDSENVKYWERYARINRELKQLKAADHGFEKAMEFGNYEAAIWINRCDILIGLSQLKLAVTLMEEALNYYPENADILYRLAGLYFKINDNEKGQSVLRKAYVLDKEKALILYDLFPHIYQSEIVQNYLSIKNH